MQPGTWEQRESNVLTHVKAKNVLFRGIQRVSWYVKHKWSAWEDREVHLFRGRIFLLFWCHCTWRTTQRIIKTLHHAGKMHERSLRAFPTAVCCTSIKARREKGKELGGEKSWKPLVSLQSVNRPLDSGDQASESGSGGGLYSRSGLKMKNASMRKEICIKQGVAFDLKTCNTAFCSITFCTVQYFVSLSFKQGLCKSKHFFIKKWLIQRHSKGIMGIISPTLCHKCMQHASEWQEQWPLSLPSPGWRWGGASWEADRQTGSYSRILQRGLPQTPATSSGT